MEIFNFVDANKEYIHKQVVHAQQVYLGITIWNHRTSFDQNHMFPETNIYEIITTFPSVGCGMLQNTM